MILGYEELVRNLRSDSGDCARRGMRDVSRRIDRAVILIENLAMENKALREIAAKQAGLNEQAIQKLLDKD